MIDLLDEFVPIVAGSEVNDHPFQPLSRYARDLVAKMGDDTPSNGSPRSAVWRKLATPDVSVADLIGDVDPIKAANEKLSYADERVIHFGIIPDPTAAYSSSMNYLTSRRASRWLCSTSCRKEISRSGVQGAHAARYAVRLHG